MDKQVISFNANEQQLTRIGGECHYSSNKVSYIEAHFDLGANWDSFDSVRAVWWTDFVKGISTVLDSDGICIVPTEVLRYKGKVSVNLVGSISVADVLTDRLTSYPITALVVDANARVESTETAEITPSQFDQFVAIVRDEVEEVTGMSAEAETLPAGSEATASYSDGVLTLGIPRGEQGEAGQDGRDGEDGNGVESAVLNSDYTLTLNFTDGTSYTTTSIRGAEGNGIRSIAKTGTSGLVDTYTITFTDGTTTTFTVTNGEKGDAGDTGLTPSFSIGTVETLEPNEQATATITGTDENPVLNLGIPQGEDGEVPDLESILPTDTASGSIASFPDGTDLVPCKSLQVALDPIQDLHGYDKPWSGGNGKNKMPQPTISLGGTNPRTANIYFDTPLPIGTYICSWQVSGTYTGTAQAAGIGTYASDNSSSSYGINKTTGALVTTKDTARLYFYMPQTNYDNGETIIYSNFQIEQGSTATAYEPYTNICPISGRTEVDTIVSPTTEAEDGNTYTTDLGRTVYGGTLDVVSGVLTVDRAMVDLGTLTWTLRSTGTNHKGWSANLPSPYITANTETPVLKWIASDCPYVGGTSGSAITIDGADSYGIGVYHFNTTSDTLQTSAYTITDVNSSPSGQLCYELATPQTYQLTPQEVSLLLGANNVWSDGDVTVVYNADIQRWVEKKLS